MKEFFVADISVSDKMGADTLLNTSSVEEECGGAIFSEVFAFLVPIFWYFPFGFTFLGICFFGAYFWVFSFSMPIFGYLPFACMFSGICLFDAYFRVLSFWMHICGYFSFWLHIFSQILVQSHIF